MLLQFNSSESQVNSTQVATLSFDRNNMTVLDDGNFICNFSNATQEFHRIVQLRTCPLPESNYRCYNNASHLNSSVIAGTAINALLSNWSGGVQLECWALNPYMFTAFPKVQQSTWRIARIPDGTTSIPDGTTSISINY